MVRLAPDGLLDEMLVPLVPAPYWSPFPHWSREEEEAMLEDQAQMLEEQLTLIKKRLEELKKEEKEKK
jgi:hypothetical protein